MVEEKNNSEIIKEIQDRIQFIIVISIFFPAVMQYFFNIYDKTKADSTALSYTTLVGLYLVFYILFEILKNKISIIWLKMINILMLVGIGLFFIPILFLSLVEKLPNFPILLTLFTSSLYGLLIIPSLLIIFILWSVLLKLK